MGLAGQGSSSSPAAGAAAPARSYSIYLRLLTIILATLAMVWMLVIGTTWYLTRHEVNELLDAHLEQTALMLAAMNGHTATAQRLLALRANPALVDRDGLTAAQLAAQRGHARLVELLEAAR